MLLSEILKKLSKENAEVSFRTFGDVRCEKIEISKIVTSSKKCNETCIFACIQGTRFDGNDFLKEAAARGTLAILTEKQDAELELGIVIITNNARKSVAEISKILFGLPKGSMITVGITGTKGKSTVCELLAETLRRLGVKTLSVGTLGAFFDKKYELENTTPDSSFLYPKMKEAYENGAKVAVIEVSSQALKDYRVYGIPFDIVSFTSFGTDHIGAGEHASLADYISAKRSLFTSYGAPLAVVNYDDAYSGFFSSGVRDVIKCGESRGADFKIQSVREGFFGMSFRLCGITGCYALSGKFNATNIAIAAAIAQKVTGKSLAQILDVMSNIRVKGRFECYNIRSRFAIIDYAHNEKSFRELFSSIREITNKKIIAVFGSVGERSKNRRRELSGVASCLADFSVITSDNPGFENPYEIAEEMYSFFDNPCSAKIIPERRDAIRFAFSKSRPGDVILLLGKGHEEYMIDKGKRVKFSEREVLSEIKKYGIPEI